MQILMLCCPSSLLICRCHHLPVICIGRYRCSPLSSEYTPSRLKITHYAGGPLHLCTYFIWRVTRKWESTALNASRIVQQKTQNNNGICEVNNTYDSTYQTRDQSTTVSTPQPFIVSTWLYFQRRRAALGGILVGREWANDVEFSSISRHGVIVFGYAALTSLFACSVAAYGRNLCNNYVICIIC